MTGTGVWRLMVCPECRRVASVAPWCARPVCVHAWESSTPEVWDGDDANGEGRPIEFSPNEKFRRPGPNTWAEMVPYGAQPSAPRDNRLGLRVLVFLAVLLVIAVMPLPQPLPVVISVLAYLLVVFPVLRH